MARMQWTAADRAIVQAAPNFRIAAARLPHRPVDSVRMKWYQERGRRRHYMVYTLARPPHSEDEQQLGRVLAALRQVAIHERRALDVSALLRALGNGLWRELEIPGAEEGEI